MDAVKSILLNYKSGWSLSRDFYFDQALFNLEMKAIWKKNWLFAGFACEIPEAGDFFTYAVGNLCAIIIRDDEGEIHAHHNSCRHRGSVICIEERGNEDNLKCPYHNWVYEKNGNLRNARMMPAEFNKADFGLLPVHLQMLEGVIFISFASQPPKFNREKEDLGRYLHTYQLNNAKVAYRDRYELDANWKLIGENFRECYHCGPAHVEYCNAVVGANLVEERDETLNAMLPVWASKGLAVETVENIKDTAHFAVRYPLRKGVESYSLNGKPVAPLMGKHTDYENGVLGIINFPNFWMDGVSDYLWVMRITPVDEFKSVVDLTWLVDGKAVEGVDYDLDRLTEFWKITGEQDWHLCENNQKGIKSDFYTSGPLARSETDVVSFHKWYIDRLLKELDT
jgi:glycine betaine catabolism A